MGDFLKGLGRSIDYGAGGSGKSAQDQLQELRQRQLQDASMDIEAKKNGFKDGQQMLDWARQRNMATGGTIPSAPAGANPMMMHPKKLLDYVLQKYQDFANGN